MNEAQKEKLEFEKMFGVIPTTKSDKTDKELIEYNNDKDVKTVEDGVGDGIIVRTGKASMQKLDDLHGMITEYYIRAIESGEELSSGTLAAINSMLKQNDITVDITSKKKETNMSDKLKLMLEKRNQELNKDI